MSQTTTPTPATTVERERLQSADAAARGAVLKSVHDAGATDPKVERALATGPMVTVHFLFDDSALPEGDFWDQREALADRVAQTFRDNPAVHEGLVVVL